MLVTERSRLITCPNVHVRRLRGFHWDRIEALRSQPLRRINLEQRLSSILRARQDCQTFPLRTRTCFASSRPPSNSFTSTARRLTLFHSFAFDFRSGKSGRCPTADDWWCRADSADRRFRSPSSSTTAGDHLNQTPSAFRQLIRRGARGGREGSRSSARHLEARRWSPRRYALVRTLRRPTPSTREHVWDHGDDGPRDYRPITLEDLNDRNGKQPIGRATRTHLRPRPDVAARTGGVAGEIYVGGGVARLSQSARLDGRRFLPDPFSNHRKALQIGRPGTLADGRPARSSAGPTIR